jgi:hypothetical protein
VERKTSGSAPVGGGPPPYVMTELHKQGRYDRMSEDYLKLIGKTPTSMADFVKLHAAEFMQT